MRELPDPIGREEDLRYVVQCIAEAHCCSIVGVSNMGKSTLMRALTLPEIKEAVLAEAADEHLWVYIDCNRVLERSEQGFYELILRSIRDKVQEHGNLPALQAQLEEIYATLIHPPTAFHVPLSFNQAIEEAVLEAGFDALVLCFDEFDPVMTALPGTVFRRLRALKDRFDTGVCYVTATDRPLWEIRNDRDAEEFYELFTPHTRYLAPLGENGVRHVVQRWAEREGIAFDEADLQFIRSQADGHPGLLQAVCWALSHAMADPAAQAVPRATLHRVLEERLPNDLIVRSECAKLWGDLSSAEQEQLLRLVTPGDRGAAQELETLQRKHLVRYTANGPALFCPLFEAFVRQERTRRLPDRGVRVDLESGHVYVDGRQIEPLTDLEYRLLALLYRHLDEVVDKYAIVEGVWGTEYIDEVDDARIERLVSRLRAKIEPDPHTPQYLQTVRGRGYRLVSAGTPAHSTEPLAKV